MNALTVLASEACSIVCAVSAGVLAYNGIDGWGWFLGIAVLTGVTSIRSTEGKS